MTWKHTTLSASAVVLLSTHAYAIDQLPSGWDRPTDSAAALSDLTTYQQWGLGPGQAGIFDSAFSLPDVAVVANTPEVLVNPFETASSFSDVNQINPGPPGGPGPFITSGGNIYSFATTNSFIAEIPSPDLVDGNTSVFMQIRTQGSPLDVDFFTINGVDATAFSDFSYSQSVAGSGNFGVIVDHVVEFTAPDVSGDFTLGFGAVTTSLSLDVLVIDSQVAIPEPASALTLTAMAGLFLRRRR